MAYGRETDRHRDAWEIGSRGAARAVDGVCARLAAGVGARENRLEQAGNRK
jgi:hypothetical protein